MVLLAKKNFMHREKKKKEMGAEKAINTNMDRCVDSVARDEENMKLAQF